MRAPARPVQLLAVSFDPIRTRPAAGVAATGREQEFEGGLGLLRLLEIHHQYSARDTARCDRRGLHMATASNDTAPIALQPSRGSRCGCSASWSRSRPQARPRREQPRSSSIWDRAGAARHCTCSSREDEWFYVMEGELTFWVGGQVINAPGPARSSTGQRGIPHTFTVSSEAGPVPARDRTGRLRGIHARGLPSRPRGSRSRRRPAPHQT